MKEHMLTTIDNPHSPVTDWDAWFQFDEGHGYKTTALLARVAKTSYDLSDADQSLAIEDAIEEIVRENVNGMYRKVPVISDEE